MIHLNRKVLRSRQNKESIVYTFVMLSSIENGSAAAASASQEVNKTVNKININFRRAHILLEVIVVDDDVDDDPYLPHIVQC